MSQRQILQNERDLAFHQYRNSLSNDDWQVVVELDKAIDSIR